MRYQVAIVGGGPAGAWLARELARAHISTVLCERSKVAGEPNFSSAGSPLETVAEFDLPRSAVAAEWEKFSIDTPHRTLTWAYGEPAGHVYDFRELKRELLLQAAASGADIQLGTPITGIRSDGGITSILAKDGTSFAADIVVDASGPAGVIASNLGLRKPKMAAPSPGLEVLCEHPSFTARQRTMAVYLGSTWTPHGYAWVFPMGGTQLKIGVGVCRPDERLQTHTLQELLDLFIARLQLPSDVATVETHGGYLYLTGGIRQHVRGNVIAIGDAADQVHPAFGEGIRHVLYSARFAKEAILEALRAKDVHRLERYNESWRGYVGRRWRRASQLSALLYTHLSDGGYDRILDIVSHLSPAELFAVGFDYKKRPFLRACGRYLRAGARPKYASGSTIPA